MNIKKIDLSFKGEEDSPITLVIGFFDGVHLGHQKLLKAAKCSGAKVAVLTFSDDLTKLKKQPLLFTQEERANLLYHYGADTIYELAFTDEVKNLSPESFLAFIERLNPSKIIVGSDFRFGKDGAGSYFDIQKFGRNHGIETEAIEPEIDINTGKKISASTIRYYLLHNEIERANELLGFNYYRRGKVVKGLRNGHRIGFPTANLSVDKGLIKLNPGVYKTVTTIDNKKYLSMTNIGNHPTINALCEDIIETNIFDFNEDIYGKTIKVSFLSYLRKQTRFSSLEELQAQLKKDAKIIQASSRSTDLQ